jgi:CelD/BcsL family acetyltransferase involved in cellulose biosynthesis
VKIDVHDRLEAVGAAEWDGLLARTAIRSPFLSWTWQDAWVRAFASDRRLEIRRVVDSAGRLIGLLPLHEVSPGLLRIVGGTDVSDYLDLMAEAGREEDAWRALLESRAASPAVWDLHAVPVASPTARALAEMASPWGLEVTSVVEDRCPVLALPESWEAYLASLPGKHRHELTRKMRRLEREIPSARAVGLAGRDAPLGRLGDFLALHRRSRTGKARFMDAPMEAFFRSVVAGLAARDQLRLWLLDTADGPVASFITIEWDGSVGLYNSGFEPARAALAPGLVLLARVIQDAIERGKRRFDFLRGEERYKYEFGPRPEDVHHVVIRPSAPPAGPSGEGAR